MPGTIRAPQAAALDELKAYLRLETADEDALLQGFLRSATAVAEAFTGQMFLARDLVDRVEEGVRQVVLRGRPLINIQAISRQTADGDEPLALGEWHVDRMPSGRAAVMLRGPAEAPLTVRYRAGMADDWNGLAEPLRFSVVRVAAHSFAHRDRADDPGYPPLVWQLLAPWRAVAL
jgi:uncharacterized phiE125 gp8 family phage protein